MTISKKQIRSRISNFLFVLKNSENDELYLSFVDDDFYFFNSDSYEQDENNIKVEVNFNERGIVAYFKKVCEILQSRNFVII